MLLMEWLAQTVTFLMVNYKIKVERNKVKKIKSLEWSLSAIMLSDNHWSFKVVCNSCILMLAIFYSFLDFSSVLQKKKKTEDVSFFFRNRHVVEC